MTPQISETYRGARLEVERYPGTGWRGWTIIRVRDDVEGSDLTCQRTIEDGTHRTFDRSPSHRRPHRTIDAALACGRAIVDERRGS